jgi:hypothetical protein
MAHYLESTNRTHVQISLPTAVIDAMVLAGFLQTTDRSDGYKLADAVRSIVAAHLEPEIAQVEAAAANRKLAEDSSFGYGSASTATQG